MPAARWLPALFVMVALFPAYARQQPVVGLITKTETNPFLVKMREGATEAARANGLFSLRRGPRLLLDRVSAPAGNTFESTNMVRAQIALG